MLRSNHPVLIGVPIGAMVATLAFTLHIAHMKRRRDKRKHYSFN